MKPLIGISSAIFKSEDIINAGIMHLDNIDLVRSPIDYANVVSQVGGLPFIIPTITKDNVEEIVSRIDGLLLTGGSDIHPSLFNEELIENNFEIMKSDLKRDLFEIELIKYAIKLKKPILGICRGMQLLNVYFSGSIHQELSDNIKTNLSHLTGLDDKRKIAHSIKIEDESKLYTILKKNELSVNSFHHQGVNKLGNNLKVVARSSDGLIEAIESELPLFILGLQWHPEMFGKTNEDQLKIFKYFIKKSGLI